MKFRIITIIFIITSLGSVLAQHSELRLVKALPDINSSNEHDFLIHPYDIDMTDNSFLVSDAIGCYLKEFSFEGTFIRKIGAKGKGPGELLDPFVFSYDRIKNRIYISNQGNGKITVFDYKSGNYLTDVRTYLTAEDLYVQDGYIYTFSYNEATKTLINLYDPTLKINRSFGNFLFNEINNLKFKRVFYSSGEIKSYHDTIYLCLNKTPYINVFSKTGLFIRTIKLNSQDLQKLYNENLDNGNDQKNGRINVLWVTQGFSIVKNEIIVFSRANNKNEIKIFDLFGKPKKVIPLKKEKDEKFYMTHFLKEKMNYDYVFIDIGSSQVKIYREYTN